MLKAADLFQWSIAIPYIIPAHIDVFFSYWHEFAVFGLGRNLAHLLASTHEQPFLLPLYLECAKMEKNISFLSGITLKVKTLQWNKLAMFNTEITYHLIFLTQEMYWVNVHCTSVNRAWFELGYMCVCVCVWVFICTIVMYVWMYVCMSYVCVCMYVCMCMYVCT
jgi:hypothetical protein